jgi:hypothetical protein
MLRGDAPWRRQIMKYLVLIAAFSLLAVPAVAQVTCCYSWEDGGTIHGFYGNLVDATNVTGPQTGSQGSTLPDYTCPGAFDGDRYLHVAEDPHYSTPQAYLAWVTDLQPGDVVTAGFYGYDITAGGSPSWRIWGHYADSFDVNSYYGSAGGNDTYTAGTGWDYIEHTWTFAASDSAATALVIEGRLYSTPSTSDPDHTDYWADYICVTAPTTACIHFPPPTSPVEESSWTNIKSLYR